MRSKIVALGCGLLLIVLALIGGAVYYFSKPSAVSQQLPTDFKSLAVTLVAPQDGTTWPLDVGIHIHAQAAGNKPIVSFELWIDGELAQTENASRGGFFSWNWVFSREGWGDIIGHPGNIRRA